MKQHLLNSICLIGLLFIASGCDQNETMDGQGGNEDNTQFTIHAGEIQGFSGDRYIMATSPTSGEVLFWDVMTSFQDSITFDAGDSETVDLTYASEYGTGFNITTYRDVKSEFKFSRYLYSCFEGQLSFDDLGGKSVDIIFTGTKEIAEFINPAYDHSDIEVAGGAIIDHENKIVYDSDNNVTVINAVLGSTNMDVQFTFRFIGEQEYKSIIIKREDWVKVDDDNYKLEVEVEDLFMCNVHEIDIGIDGAWIIDSEVLASNGDRISIAQWSHYAQNQMGDRIKLFLQEGLMIDELLLKIRGNNINEGIQFQKVFENIPTTISLLKQGNEVLELTPSTFNFSTTDNYDVVKSSYRYKINNHLSSWDVYQSSSSTTDYTLPIIESGYLDETTFIKSVLMNPVNFKMQFYTLETDVNQVYNITGIDRQLQCLSYTSSYDSYEL